MAPIIGVEGGRPIIATGGAGGSTIIMGTLFTVLDRIEFGLDLAHAVDAERLDAQGVLEGDPVLVENTRLLPGVVSALKARGHKLEAEGEYADKPRVQAAGYRSPGGPLKDAVSDSRTEAGSLAQR
jgi:gamma-glutamyltranspeptidase